MSKLKAYGFGQVINGTPNEARIAELEEALKKEEEKSLIY